MDVHYFAAIFGLGIPELVIILVVLMLLFGAKKLPELARSLGSSVKEVRKGMDADDKTVTKKQEATEPDKR